jgi:alpha-tubulin suppressor-like RCC1 family protein
MRRRSQAYRGAGARAKGKHRKYWFIDWQERSTREDGSVRSIHRAANLGFCDQVSKEEADAKALQLLEHRRAPDYISISPMEQRSQNAVRLGAMAELMATCHLMQNGYEVFHAACPQSSCDLIALGQDSRAHRVEVKFCPVNENGTPKTSLQRNRGKFDILVVVTPTGKVYQLTPEEAEPRRVLPKRSESE